MRHKTFIALAITGLLIVTASDFWISQKVRSQRSTLFETVSTARHETAKLYEEFGFGGMIHAFKNYVLRGDARYSDTVRAKAHSILIRIDRLLLASESLGLDVELGNLRRTITAYSDQLPVVTRMRAENRPIDEIDDAVRINDAAALQELAFLEAQVALVTRTQIARLSRTSTIQDILTPLLQMTMLAFMLFLWSQMHRNHVQSAHQADRQLSNLRASLDAQTLTIGRIKKSNEALSRFSGMVAHDLKSPLRQAAIFLQLSGRTTDKAERDERYAQATECITRANTIVDSFLNLAQLGDQPPDTNLEDISCIFNEALDEVQAVHKVESDSVEISPLGEAFCDRDLIRQVAVNLLTNAVKYARPDQLLKISVDARRIHDRLKITVVDNGVGVPDDIRDTLFEPRIRGKGERDRAPEGIGLGLALCKAIITAHGGEISAEAHEGQGARFAFTLPLAQPGLQIY